MEKKEKREYYLGLGRLCCHGDGLFTAEIQRRAHVGHNDL